MTNLNKCSKNKELLQGVRNPVLTCYVLLITSGSLSAISYSASMIKEVKHASKTEGYTWSAAPWPASLKASSSGFVQQTQEWSLSLSLFHMNGRLMAIIFLPFVEENYKFKKMNVHAWTNYFVVMLFIESTFDFWFFFSIFVSKFFCIFSHHLCKVWIIHFVP